MNTDLNILPVWDFRNSGNPVVRSGQPDVYLETMTDIIFLNVLDKEPPNFPAPESMLHSMCDL